LQTLSLLCFGDGGYSVELMTLKKIYLNIKSRLRKLQRHFFQTNPAKIHGAPLFPGRKKEPEKVERVLDLDFVQWFL